MYLNAKKPNFVPLYFYNGSKFDIHLFIKELAKTKLKLKKFASKTKKVFENNCKAFADYTIMCLKQDVKLLLNVFEKFTDKCIDEHKIDPCYRYSSPGLSWICGSKIYRTKIKTFPKRYI